MTQDVKKEKSQKMKSKYASVCPKCKQRFVIGVSEITKDEALQKWVHVNCDAAAYNQKQSDLVGSTYTTTAAKPAFQASRNMPVEITDDVPTFDLEKAVAEAEANDAPIIEHSFIPSVYQQAIFDFISDPLEFCKSHNLQFSANAVVEAVAGSGKTTTIVQALQLTPSNADVAFVAFNKHIAAELEKRAPSHVHVSTLHSLGVTNLRAYNGGKINIKTDKVGSILDNVWEVSKEAYDAGRIDRETRKINYAKRLSMRRLVSIAKSVLINVDDVAEVLSMIEKYNVEIDDEYLDELVSKLSYVMTKCKEDTYNVDFDDMIWLPVVCKMKLTQFDYLFVDEAQDMNKCQIDFILHSIKDDGRIIAVGDRNQSLYGFRGADTDAIPNLINMLDAIVLPLSVTYRCPASHVALAKQLVPQLEARENAAEGSIRKLDYFDLVKELQPGDMVICRTNAPLIKPAFECIRRGMKAIIRGKDIGDNLINMVKRFETNDIGQFDVALGEYFQREYTKLLDKGKEMQAIELNDKVETLRFIMNECSNVAELISKIDVLFNDNNQGVIFSSVHRAKGLEASKVYILRPDLMPHPKADKEWEKVQELNCVYVAQTRSKQDLIFVEGGDLV